MDHIGGIGRGRPVSPAQPIMLPKYLHATVEVTGSGTFSIEKPYKLPCSAPFPTMLVENMTKAGIDSLTPIQCYAMPYIVGGRDLMGLACNGSGKTAAYLLPIISSLMARNEPPHVDGNRISPAAFILLPHRQLVKQVMDECRKFARNTEIECCGGTDEKHERSALAGGCHILVATPPCLIDYIEANVIALDECKFLVLDEADMLLSMEFEPEIRRMVESAGMPAEHQTLMFSMTFPSMIQNLAHDFMKDEVFVVIGGGNENIEQRIIKVDDRSLYESKRKKLFDLLREYYKDYQTMTADEKKDVKKTIIFVGRTAVGRNRFADVLALLISQDESLPLATSMHRDRYEIQRDIALSDFKNGTTPILVATNVASRGLDIRGLHHVIIYDMPEWIYFDEYVRQVGRTGRHGNPGLVTAFFDPLKDSRVARQLKYMLHDANQVVPDWLRALEEDGEEESNLDDQC